MPEGACGSWSDVCSSRASQELSRVSCTLPVLHCTDDSQQTVVKGHSRPMQSVLVPINVRCYSDSDMIVRRSEVTLKAKSGSRPLRA